MNVTNSLRYQKLLCTSLMFKTAVIKVHTSCNIRSITKYYLLITNYATTTLYILFTKYKVLFIIYQVH